MCSLCTPRLPVLSVCDLGIVREVRPDAAEPTGLEVVLTPTYSGCPATEVISQSVREALEQAGLGPVRVSLQRAPAWTTDWISEAGRRKLREYGIAPPGPVAADGAVPVRFMARRPVPGSAVDCPRCGSAHTERLSAFVSTGSRGVHSEHMGFILAEMQHLQRAYPGGRW